MIIQIPGMYASHVVSNEDYHNSPGLSNSKMSLLLPPSCPKNFLYQEKYGVHKDTDAFNLGSAVHTLCFEPGEFAKRYYPVQEVPKRNSNLGKAAFEAMTKQAGGRMILDKEECDIIQAMAKSVTSHTVWRNLMKKIKDDGEVGSVEYSLCWEDSDHGVLLRSRPDFFTSNIIIDLKTTKDSTPHVFSRAIAEYSYHRQAALACDGLTRLTGRIYDNVMLFVVDKNPPHFSRCYVLPQSAINQGRYEYKEAARIYAECLRTQTWEGYPEVIEDLDIPNYAYRTFDNG